MSLCFRVSIAGCPRIMLPRTTAPFTLVPPTKNTTTNTSSKDPIDTHPTTGPTITLKTANMAGGDPEHKPIVAITDTLRTEDGPNEEDRTVPGTGPFFRLPRELRDEIYNLAALGEDTIYYDIALKADEPPQKTAYTRQSTDRSFSDTQFEVEFAVAIENRVKALMGGCDQNGLHLCGPGRRHEKASWKGIWLEVSEGKRPDSEVSQNIHAVKLDIPLEPSYMHPGHEPSMVVAFKFPAKVELGPRIWFDCFWVTTDSSDRYMLVVPSKDDSVVQQLRSIAKEVSWTGSVREYMLWERYIARYVRFRRR